MFGSPGELSVPLLAPPPRESRATAVKYYFGLLKERRAASATQKALKKFEQKRQALSGKYIDIYINIWSPIWTICNTVLKMGLDPEVITLNYFLRPAGSSRSKVVPELEQAREIVRLAQSLPAGYLERFRSSTIATIMRFEDKAFDKVGKELDEVEDALLKAAAAASKGQTVDTLVSPTRNPMHCGSQ